MTATESREDSFGLSALMGRPILNADAELVGHIEDILVAREGSVKAALVNMGGVLGVGARRVVVPFKHIALSGPHDCPDVSICDLKAGEVLVAAEYHPPGRTAAERAKEQATSISRKTLEGAEEIGRNIGRKARQLTHKVKTSTGEIDRNRQAERAHR